MPSEVNSQTVRAGACARYSSDSQRDATISTWMANNQLALGKDGAGLQGGEIDPSERHRRILRTTLSRPPRSRAGKG